MYTRLLTYLLSGLLLSNSAYAQNTEESFAKVDALREKGAEVQQISPIFGQIVSTSLPKGFQVAFETTTGGGTQYIREAVLQGETVKKWSQMLTVTGFKNLASNPKATPKAFASAMAGGFQRACPSSFGGINLGAVEIDGFESQLLIISCGTASASDAYSETTLLLVIKGAKDLYTLQWAERGAASEKPIQIDHKKWSERYRMLQPIKLCDIVPNEPAPYPSCVNRAVR